MVDRVVASTSGEFTVLNLGAVVTMLGLATNDSCDWSSAKFPSWLHKQAVVWS
jgi:hypothetical protein